MKEIGSQRFETDRQTDAGDCNTPSAEEQRGKNGSCDLHFPKFTNSSYNFISYYLNKLVPQDLLEPLICILQVLYRYNCIEYIKHCFIRGVVLNASQHHVPCFQRWTF